MQRTVFSHWEKTVLFYAVDNMYPVKIATMQGAQDTQIGHLA